jgi:hypothetical protein
MNEITKALLTDLQSDLDRMKWSESNIEVVWSLDTMVQTIREKQELIRKSIETKS